MENGRREVRDESVLGKTTCIWIHMNNENQMSQVIARSPISEHFILRPAPKCLRVKRSDFLFLNGSQGGEATAGEYNAHFLWRPREFEERTGQAVGASPGPRHAQRPQIVKRLHEVDATKRFSSACSDTH